MLNKYIVTVQELHETKYLVSNAVAPQQAQEWIEIYIEDDLSELIGQNISEISSDFVTDGRNNIVENLKDIKVEKVGEQKKHKNNTEWLKDVNPDVPNMGCTCGYDEEEDVSTMDGNLSDIQEAYKGFIKKHAPNWNNEETCCPDDKCNCNS